ncbi:MAG: hypothetical protein R3C52_01865 [Hyphomonadaceae bacterium]
MINDRLTCNRRSQRGNAAILAAIFLLLAGAAGEADGMALDLSVQMTDVPDQQSVQTDGTAPVRARTHAAINLFLGPAGNRPRN